MAILSEAPERAQAQQTQRIYCRTALVSNPDGTVDYEDLPHVVYCLLEEMEHLSKQLTGARPKKRARVSLTASIEF